MRSWGLFEGAFIGSPVESAAASNFGNKSICIIGLHMQIGGVCESRGCPVGELKLPAMENTLTCMEYSNGLLKTCLYPTFGFLEPMEMA